MICRNCGNEIRDDARFCPHCGAMNSPDVGSGLPQGAATYGGSPSWEGPEGGGKKKKTGLMIGAAVAAVAVIALIVVAVSALFGSPKGTLEKALVKSAAAYAAAEERLGIPDINQWQRDRSLAQRFALELRSINSDLVGYDLSALEGLGLRMNTDYDGSGRRLSFDLGAYWGDEDLFTFRTAADDDEMYFYLPQFTGDTYYGVNTETLGHDLAEMTGDDSMDSVSFNMFDLMDLILESIDQEKLEQDLNAAGKTLWEAAEVKKSGAMTLNLNGTSTKTAAYHVTFPQEALERYVDDMAVVMSTLNYYDLYEEMFRSMGMPEEELEDFMSELESMDTYDELAGILKDALDEFGDLELDVCLSGGYVSAVLYKGKIDGVNVELSLYLGGNEEYVDDLTMEIIADDLEIRVKSTGDHGLKGGVYTDETEVRVRQRGSTLGKLTSELSWDPRGRTDNFHWDLGVESSGLSLFGLETQGDLSAGEDAVSLRLDDISIQVLRMEVCNLLFDYSISRNPDPMDLGNSRLITEMDMTELMALGAQIERNAEDWTEEMQSLFIARLPAELPYGMMY